jgi:hypothetical protein
MSVATRWLRLWERDTETVPSSRAAACSSTLTDVSRSSSTPTVAHGTSAARIASDRASTRELVALLHGTPEMGAYAAWRRVVMSDACLAGMAFGLWRTTRSSGLAEQGS